MRLRPRQGLLAGIAILAAGSVVLEIALARISAALFGPHFALAAPTLALLGAGLGGALCAALPGLVRRPALLARLSYLAGLAATATLAMLLVLVHVKVPDGLSRAALGPLATVYLSAALPFLFVGVGVAGAVRHVPVLASRVVFALFGGAALGAPLAFGAMRAGAPRAALLVAVTYALASLLFYLGARRGAPAVQRPRGSMVATFLLASIVLFAGDLGAPWLKLPALRFAPVDKSELQEWSGLGLITVDKPQGGVSWIRTDGTAAVPLYDGKTAIPVAPDEIAYAMQHERGPVAVIGGGGGREVRIALKYGQKDIDAIELDPVLLRAVVQGQYRKTSGEPYDNPETRVALAEGHGYVRRSDELFRNIQIALPDAQAAETAGALAAEPFALYTVEAFTDLVEHLAPDGTLTVTCWDADLDSLIGLTAEALRRSGATTPPAHLYACGQARSTTLLAKKTPLTAAELTQVRNFCRSKRFNEAFASDQTHSDAYRRLMARAAAERVPTGDRPFFAQTVPTHLLLETVLDPKLAARAEGLMVLAGLLVAAAVLGFFALTLPLAAWPRWPVGRLGPLLFFTGVGAALAFAFAALVPRLVTLIGHPIYAFTTVIPALCAAVGAGALVTEGTATLDAEGPAALRAELLVVALAVAAVALGPLADGALGLPFAVRVAAAMALLVPVGVLAGGLLALGIRLVTAISPPVVPWCWGMGAVGAFAAVAVATPVALVLGYSAVLLAAGASALLAAVCVPRWLD